MVELNEVQQTAVVLLAERETAPNTSFLLGPAGSGKTTVLQHRLRHLLQQGEPAYTILVLAAEPEHRQPFLDFLHSSEVGPYAELKITTFNRLAQEMVALFWPLLARPAGFAHPYRPPTFLSYDLAQLLMWQIVTPMLHEGAFADLRLRPQQIVSQLLDTLNRSALNALSLEEGIERQIRTWTGEAERPRHLQEAGEAAKQFRQHCLENSLLDLSLVIETFDTRFLDHAEFGRYFSERYRHLIVDNVEEQTPAGQNFVRQLLPILQSAAIAYDAGGGYKRFLAADPLGANQFRTMSQLAFDFEESFVSPPDLGRLANGVENYLRHNNKPTAGAERALVGVVNGRYRREMIANLIPLLHDLIHEDGVQPRDIAIITPYLDGALRYMLGQMLREAGLPYALLRRRSSPREEPRIRAWLTWLALAHPDWEVTPAPFDVAEALTLSIDGLDPARAALLTDQLYRYSVNGDPYSVNGGGALGDPVGLPESVVARVGEEMVALVAELREWLLGQNGRLPLDHALHDLFSLLSQPHFRPEPDLAGAAVCDWLVKSAVRLRQAASQLGLDSPAKIGAAFIEGIQQGLVTANPPELGEPPDPDGIMISTIYGYLLAGRPVRVQVWLETAATGWWDIPNQPLSNAFVLAQSRDPNLPWTIEEEYKIRNQLLSRLIRGLTARCRDGIVLANSELDRRGLRQDGPLWRALQPWLPAAVMTADEQD
jgi:hypothetical protein